MSAARARLGDPLARLAFVTPSQANGEQLRRLLGSGGRCFIHVDFLTPAEIVGALGEGPLLEAGRLPEPPGWLSALLSQRVPRLAADGALGRHGPTLTEPGWRRTMESALGELQSAEIDAALLRRLVEPTPVGERLAVLATLMETVEAARAESTLYSQRELERAALAQLQADAPHPLRSVRGVLIVGDALLPPGTARALRCWLEPRDVTRIDLPPLSHLPAAPGGLQEAAGACRTLRAEPPPTRLGHLQRHLFCAPLTPGPAEDATVALVATPDEIREMEEVARTVQQAIREGVPLDRIAIVLPDAEQAHVLESALSRASIPAVWLIGPTLARTGAASFLTLALSLAARGADRAPWYTLLTQPGLRRPGSRGRLRWRGLLADSLDAGGDDLPAAVEAQAPDPDADPAQAAAAASLAGLLRELRAALDALPEQGSLEEHAQAWSALLLRYWDSSEDRGRVLQLLQGWRGARGVEVPRSVAVGLLQEALAGTAYLKGSLTQPAVRVLPPMLLLGGAYARVCVTGLSEGRFPRRAAQNSLLTDAVVEHLRAAGAPLISPDDREQVERRRLAAVIAGCDGRLWLGSPAFEMLKGRPQQPSSLLLEVASTLAGRRVAFQALEAAMLRRGSRSRPVPQRPADALGGPEFLLARVAHAPAAALPVLATREVARRLMQLHRSIDRLARGGAPDPWTGRVPLESMPQDLVTDLVLDARQLAAWAMDPGAYFIHEVLGASRARGLNPRGTYAAALQRELIAAMRDAAPGDPEHFQDRLAAGWSDRLDRLQRSLGADADERARWSWVGERAATRVLAAWGGSPEVVPATAEGAPLHPTLPVRLQGDLGWLEGQQLVALTRKDGLPRDKMNDHLLRLTAQAVAREGQGEAVSSIRVINATGGASTRDLASCREELTRHIEVAHARTALGWWPSGDGLALGREHRGARSLEMLQREIERLGGGGGER